MSTFDQDTAEYFAAEVLSSGFFATGFAPVRLDVGAATHPGKCRAENQDHYAVIRRRRSQEVLAADVPFDETWGVEEAAYLLMVADGMGGAAFGEFASRVVIQMAWELTARAASWVMKLKNLEAQQVRERVEAYVKAIEQSLREHGDADPRLTGMGTTMTAVYVMGQDAIIAQIGDSRAYLFRDGILTQITKDQTLAQKMIDMGCQPEQVAGLRHVLVNSLCADGHEAQVEIYQLTVADGDMLLLCTDGLANDVSDEEICNRLTDQTAGPQLLCDQLVEMALGHGGRDNVAVVIAKVAKEPALLKPK